MAYSICDLDGVPAFFGHLALDYHCDCVTFLNGIRDVFLSFVNQDCDAASFSANLKCVSVYGRYCTADGLCLVQAVLGLF